MYHSLMTVLFVAGSLPGSSEVFANCKKQISLQPRIGTSSEKDKTAQRAQLSWMKKQISYNFRLPQKE